MWNRGDLVEISSDCAIQYFAGKTAIILENIGKHMGNKEELDHYYRVHFPDGSDHIFNDNELTLLSKA